MCKVDIDIKQPIIDDSGSMSDIKPSDYFIESSDARKSMILERSNSNPEDEYIKTVAAFLKFKGLTDKDIVEFIRIMKKEGKNEVS